MVIVPSVLLEADKGRKYTGTLLAIDVCTSNMELVILSHVEHEAVAKNFVYQPMRLVMLSGQNINVSIFI